MWVVLFVISTSCCLHGGLANTPPTIVKVGTISVKEDTPVNTAIFNITAYDPDHGDNLLFDTSNKDVVYLDFPVEHANNKTCQVKLKTELDADKGLTTMYLNFEVSDGVYTTKTTVNVIILDVNDEKPKFSEGSYRITVKESAVIGEEVIKVTATDPDQGTGSHVFYGLQAKGQSSEDYRYTFVINTRTGSITLNQSLDYEDRTFYQYNVTAWDNNIDESLAGNRADPVDLFVTVIDVQDTPPFFRNIPYIETIEENSTIGTFVLKVLAQDGDLGVPNEIAYSIVENFADGGSDSFEINNVSGTITTAGNLDSDSEYMKERNGIITFNVNASEIDSPGDEQLGLTSSQTSVTINIKDVNDNRPNFSVPVIRAYVDENTAVGVPVRLEKQVEVVDIDMTAENNQFKLFVELNGTAFRNFDIIPEENQAVSQSNIMIRVNNSDFLDYEERSNVTFQVVAKESRSTERFSCTVEVVLEIININDNTPEFENKTYVFQILENATEGTIVGNVFATDADFDNYGDVSYDIIDSSNTFNILAENGSITVHGAPLDRETKQMYSLTVLAYDNDTVSRRTGEARVEIQLQDVNDNCPIFEPTLRIPLSEDIELGTIVTTVTARDKDEGENAKVLYYIFDEHNVTRRFVVNDTTGAVSVNESLVGMTGERYITIEGRDQGQPSRSGYHELVFRIRDVNLNHPVFLNPSGEYNTSFPFLLYTFEQEERYTPMMMLNATDADVGQNGQVSYRIEPGPYSNLFNVNHTTGLITNNDVLDRETLENYTIIVSAQDGGTPTLRTSIPITVQLLDIDDNEPYFPDRQKSISVEEEKEGCFDDNIDFAEDKDQWENNTRKCYYIQSGTQPYTQSITLNQTTGALCFTQKLDREVIPKLDILVMVSRHCNLTGTADKEFNDAFNKSDISLLHVTVHVKDINDNPPVFDETELNTGILYDTEIGELAYNLREHVTDKDEGENAVTYFKELSQNADNIGSTDESPFSVTLNGSVITRSLFSSTMLGYVLIEVEGYDIGNLTAKAELKIYIISNVQRIKMVFYNKEPDEVQRFKSDFINELHKALNYSFKIVVEKIVTHQLPDKTPVPGRTDMFIHGIYPSGEFVPATELWRAFDFTPGIAAVFEKYGVGETKPVVDDKIEDDDLTRKLTMGLILVAVILTLIVISLATALYCIRQKYARRLRAERTTADGFYEKDTPPPGTNLYTASNPIYMTKDIMMEEDNISMDLDDNAVDNDKLADGVDEQEMTINIDGTDALRTMTKSSALDDVLAKYAEIEKRKGDKQTLIDQHSSDGDSGTYNTLHDLEHTDI